MIVNIVQIGNSKGIRIPKVILEQCAIDAEVSLEIENGNIILRPISATPRSGWEHAFSEMAENGDDQLLLDDTSDLHSDDWQW